MALPSPLISTSQPGAIHSQAGMLMTGFWGDEAFVRQHTFYVQSRPTTFYVESRSTAFKVPSRPTTFYVQGSQ